MPNPCQPDDASRGELPESILKRSETLLKSFVRHAPAAIAMFDRDMRYIVASQRFLDDYRLSGDVTGRIHYEVFPEIPERWRLLHQRGLAGEVLRAAEDPFPRADGQLDWVRWEIRPWHGDDGQIGGIMLFTEDITERKRAEEALRASEERFRAIANYTADWESWFDPQGKLAWASPSVERITGYTPDELYALPDSVSGLLSSSGKADLALALQGGANGEPGGEFECCCSRKDGTQFWLSVTWQPAYDSRGRPLGVRTSARDMTSRRSAEEEIRRANASLEERVAERTEALTTAVKELEAFSYATAHDLRAPLRGIEGFSTILQEDYAGLLDDEGKGHLQRIRRAAQRMAQLIDDLRDLALVSRHPMRKDVVDLSRLARRVAAQIRAAEPQRTVLTEIMPGLRVCGDGDLLRRLFKELFLNAWKFTAPTAASRIVFGARPGSGETVFFVSDNGVGFDMRHAKRLFQPFQRMHGPWEFEGNGIGLASVQRIIRRHGGRVWAQSEPGQGTTIFFTLEVPRCADGPDEDVAPLQSAGRLAARRQRGHLDGLAQAH